MAAVSKAREPWPDVSPLRRRIMAANRRRDTNPELELRSALHRQGLRFRVDVPIPVPGRRPIRPDIAFTRARLAVFLDGCFWHGCPTHGSAPSANASYWCAKFARTKSRDEETNGLLRDAGWGVLRIWEHEPVESATKMVLATLRHLS